PPDAPAGGRTGGPGPGRGSLPAPYAAAPTRAPAHRIPYAAFPHPRGCRSPLFGGRRRLGRGLPVWWVMLVGDSGVGKTCLLVRFKDGAFLAGTFISTVGIDFRNKVLDVDGVKVKLQIWDTAGQERFRSVTHAYYRDAHALLLLYDVTNKASFDNIQVSGFLPGGGQRLRILGTRLLCSTVTPTPQGVEAALHEGPQ
uniref:RAB26, member RAS onco family n=1 Tax=Canis lupus familiaris TaxID=9615 RepID=A0A8P0PHT4_CANLF